MNLIDFYVTEIIEETHGKVYQLYGMSEDQLEEEKDDEWWYKFLCGNGVKQRYLCSDMGGKEEKTEVFNLDQGQKPYYVGYKGLH